MNCCVVFTTLMILLAFSARIVLLVESLKRSWQYCSNKSRCTSLVAISLYTCEWSSWDCHFCFINPFAVQSQYCFINPFAVYTQWCFQIARKRYAISKLHGSPCAISKLRRGVAQFRNCLRIFEIVTQFGDFQIAQRNFEIAQIFKMRGTYYTLLLLLDSHAVEAVAALSAAGLHKNLLCSSRCGPWIAVCIAPSSVHLPPQYWSSHVNR